MHSSIARSVRGFSLFFLLVFAFASPLAAETVAVSFGERSVTVNGITRGGDVVLFAISKEPSQSVPPIPIQTSRALVLHDDDRDGDVTFEHPHKVPVIAVWIAVDVTTGQWVASGSPGFDAVPMPLEEFAKHDNAGQLRKLSAQVPEMYVLLVRPGGGAWRMFAAKTSELDETPHERPLRIDIDAMKPLGEKMPKLNAIHRGDVVAMVEPRSMRFAVVEVGK